VWFFCERLGSVGYSLAGGAGEGPMSRFRPGDRTSILALMTVDGGDARRSRVDRFETSLAEFSNRTTCSSGLPGTLTLSRPPGVLDP